WRPALSPYARELPSGEIAASRTVDPKLDVNWRSVMPTAAEPERPSIHATTKAAGTMKATAAPCHHRQRRFRVACAEASAFTPEAAPLERPESVSRFKRFRSARSSAAL